MIVRSVLARVKPPNLGLFLYGSYARGDATEGSDIDILQIRPKHSAPYTDGDINFTCYTRQQLLELAGNGSLFVRHLLSEAIVIDDASEFLESLRHEYRAPETYARVIRDLTGCLSLVAIREDAYQEIPFQYSTTAGYLLRSVTYANAFALGATSFAMSHITEVLGDSRPRQYLSELRADRTYTNFTRVVDLLFEFTGSTRYYREESLEAVVVNSFGVCELAVVLGLRILARGSVVTYA